MDIDPIPYPPVPHHVRDQREYPTGGNVPFPLVDAVAERPQNDIYGRGRVRGTVERAAARRARTDQLTNRKTDQL